MKKKNNQKETLQIRNTIREIKSYLDGLKNRVKGTFDLTTKTFTAENETLV